MSQPSHLPAHGFEMSGPARAAIEARDGSALRSALVSAKAAGLDLFDHGMAGATRHPLPHLAIKRGWPEGLAILLDSGCPSNLRDYNAVLPLAYAAHMLEAGCAALLVARGCDPLYDKRSERRSTPIRIVLQESARAWTDPATFQQVADTLDALLAAHLLDIHAHHDGDGKSALGMAASAGPGAPIERLLRAGADPTRADMAGLTPLFHAASHGTIDALRLLAAHCKGHGLDLRSEAPDAQGDNALTAAIRSKSIEAVGILVDLGARIPATLPKSIAPGGAPPVDNPAWEAAQAWVAARDRRDAVADPAKSSRSPSL